MKSLLVDSSTFFLQPRGGISRIAAQAIRTLSDDFDVTLTYGVGGSRNQFTSDLKELPFLWDGDRFSIFRPWFRVPERFDLVLIPYMGIPLGGRAYRLLIFHDLIREATQPLSRRLPHSVVKCLSVCATNHVLPVSEATREDLVRRWPWALRACRVTTVRNAIASLPELDPPVPQRRGNVVLYVGLRTGYKNFPACIRLLRERPDLRLDVVGQAFTAEERQDWADVLHRITVHRAIDERQLSALYQSAGCLLFPSEIEGFGLPIMESLSVGTPVVVLDRPYSRELAELSGDGIYLAQEDTVTATVLQAIGNGPVRPRVVRDWAAWRADFLRVITDAREGWVPRLGQQPG